MRKAQPYPPVQAASSGEDELIARYFRPLATHPGALSLQDDAAILGLGADEELVITTDSVIAGVHFFPDDPARSIARKALRVNLSDLAAKGAEPRGFVLNLALPHPDHDWLADFAAALGADADHFACPLLGGDTVKTSGPLAIAITAFGAVPRGRMVRRSGAREGDVIVVSGTIGDAALGLALQRDGALAPLRAAHPVLAAHLVSRYREPQPRSAIAHLVQATFTSAMDVSDGLAGDLRKLCAASRVGARVEIANVPLSDAAQWIVREAEAAWLERALTGGDDYEILGTLARCDLPQAIAAARYAGVALSAIGEVMARDAGVSFLDREGQPRGFTQASFSHFS